MVTGRSAEAARQSSDIQPAISYFATQNGKVVAARDSRAGRRIFAGVADDVDRDIHPGLNVRTYFYDPQRVGFATSLSRSTGAREPEEER